MSVQQDMWHDGQNPSDNGVGKRNHRAMLAREMRYLLTISTDARRAGYLSPSGVAHSIGVCLIEDWIMARGARKESTKDSGTSLPHFVDVKLDAEGRRGFLDWLPTAEDPVAYLQRFADDGYRVGLTWSGAHQSYTLSVTCRDSESPNNGLCMTSFAKTPAQAVALAWYKHTHVCDGVWGDYDTPPTETFG